MDHSSDSKKSGGVLKVSTTRFGEMEIDEKRVIYFPEGILGFPTERHFVILEHHPDSPFCWLQSTQNPDLAFVLINPFLIEQDYLSDLPPSEKAIFEGDGAKNLVVFSIVTIPKGNPKKMTVNLLGPIVIDIAKRVGRQMVLANTRYSPRHPILS